jgi:hypothetical protein
MEDEWKQTLDMLVEEFSERSMSFDGSGLLDAAEIFAGVIPRIGTMDDHAEISDYLVSKHNVPQVEADRVMTTYAIVYMVSRNAFEACWQV